MGEEWSESSLSWSKPLLLLKQLLMLLNEAWFERRGDEEEMETGGISMESSLGGGCCHWGKGPASRRVCSSGPASITAFKSLPFSGSGFSAAELNAACGGVACGWSNSGGWGFGLVSEVATLMSLLLQSAEEEIETEKFFLGSAAGFDSSSVLAAASCGCCCCFWSCCWSKRFSSINFWHFAWASSLSLKVLFSASFKQITSTSLFAISSFADTIVLSSSKVYKKEYFNSSLPCDKI